MVTILVSSLLSQGLPPCQDWLQTHGGSMLGLLVVTPLIPGAQDSAACSLTRHSTASVMVQLETWP